MFSAFARGMTLDSTEHVQLRKDAVRYMGRHSENFIPFIVQDGNGQDQAFIKYLRTMSKVGTWGDDLVLNALCQCYNVRVSILKKTERGGLMWTHLGDTSGDKLTFWLYLEGNHYENLVYSSQLL